MSKAPLFPDQPLSADENPANKSSFIVFAGKVYLTRREVPLHYLISERTLAKLASERRGPRFFKPTDKALYLPADLEAWIEAAAILPIPDLAPPQAPAQARAPRLLIQKGRGRAKPQPRAPSGAPSGRRLKSLLPTANSWLRRND